MNDSTPNENSPTHRYTFAEAVNTGRIKLKILRPTPDMNQASWDVSETISPSHPTETNTDRLKLLTCSLETGEAVHALVDLMKQKVVLVVQGTPPDKSLQELTQIAGQISRAVSKELTFYY